ncbi:MAG: MauE/DoxX family redox-associated membrane protein [Blastocatellia bacterium]
MQRFKIVMKYLLVVLYVAAGINHFANPDFYLKMMPPYLPWHLALVYISGVAEILLGVLVLFPRYTQLAGWGLIALLIAVFPANVFMAQNPLLFPNEIKARYLLNS